jgi:hypothetical protein
MKGKHWTTKCRGKYFLFNSKSVGKSSESSELIYVLKNHSGCSVKPRLGFFNKVGARMEAQGKMKRLFQELRGTH